VKVVLYPTLPAALTGTFGGSQTLLTFQNWDGAILKMNNLDVHILLDDGREFTFTVAAPNSIFS